MDALDASLLTGAGALALACLGLSVFAWRHRQQPGWGPWMLGSVAAVLALSLSPWRSTGAALDALLEALLLAWPLAMLAGLRRFHARMPLPASARLDAGVGLAALAVLLLGALSPADAGLAALAPAAASLAVHLYAAAVLFCAPAGRDGTTVRLLGAALAGAALGAMGIGLATADDLAGLPERLAVTGVAAGLGCFVMAGLSTQRTERQLRESRRRLRWLANIDALTQVPNRRHFVELATRALSRPGAGACALVVFDVDHFKAVNDVHGHAAGDRALRLVARCVQDALRADDVPGRLGGDEFVMLLHDARTSAALAVADRIVQRLQRQAAGSGLPAITLSFGMVEMGPGEPLDDALRRADRALYEAKRQGRSRAVAAEGSEDQPVFTESQRMGLRAA